MKISFNYNFLKNLIFLILIKNKRIIKIRYNTSLLEAQIYILC